MINAINDFKDAIRAAGLEPPEYIDENRFHRFPGIGKGPSNRAGWCVLFEDGLGGCFGDWAADFSKSWRARDVEPFTADWREFKRLESDARKIAQEERERRQRKAADRAVYIWDKATPAPADHPYLLSKGIAPNGARLYKGSLVLPVVDYGEKMTSLQFIAPNGDKKLLSEGRKKGNFIPINDVSEYLANYGYGDTYQVIICEGWATGCTLHEWYPSSLVLAAIDASNLAEVALFAHIHFRGADLQVFGDDDRLTEGNPGATKAAEAARQARAELVMPRWPSDAPAHLTDFNDLDQWIKEVCRGE